MTQRYALSHILRLVPVSFILVFQEILERLVFKLIWSTLATFEVSNGYILRGNSCIL